MTPDPATLIHPATPDGTLDDQTTPEALVTWLASLDTEDDLTDTYGTLSDTLDEARATALSDLDDLILAARRILTAHHDTGRPTRDPHDPGPDNTYGAPLT